MSEKVKYVKEIEDIKFHRDTTSEELDSVSELVYELKTSGVDVPYIEFIEVTDVSDSVLGYEDR